MGVILVTGTDTGVGKTAVACGILATLRGRGLRVAGFKPAETGHAGPGWPPDAACLQDAAGTGLPMDVVVPYVFEEPLAPNVAARRACRDIEPDVLLRRLAGLADSHDLVIMEGAGGISVHVTDGADYAELAAAWHLPVLIVARAGLGTLNHTKLTVDYARHRGLDVLGVVVNGEPADPDVATRTNPDVATRTNPDELRRILDVPVLGVVPEAEIDTAAGQWGPMAALVQQHVELAPVAAQAGRGIADAARAAGSVDPSSPRAGRHALTGTRAGGGHA